jgi:hypothetical protein
MWAAPTGGLYVRGCRQVAWRGWRRGRRSRRRRWRRRRRLAAAGAPADVTRVARVAGTARVANVARVAGPARIRAAGVSGIGRSRGGVAAAWVSRAAAVARASGAGRVARAWTGVLSWWSRRRLARWSLRLISGRKRCRVRSRRRERRLRKSELCADRIQFRGGARASPGAPGDLCVVGGENFLGDDRCRLGLRNGGCASPFRRPYPLPAQRRRRFARAGCCRPRLSPGKAQADRQ